MPTLFALQQSVPHFEKGGLGGILFGRFQTQKQIPLSPPFSKGEAADGIFLKKS
jgi:hypothetical protein